MYRQTASDLAAVREDVNSKQLSLYLNQLLGRSHNLIYSGNKPKVNAMTEFYRDTYPRHFPRDATADGDLGGDRAGDDVCGLVSHAARSGVCVSIARAGDDRDDRAEENVDGFSGDDEAAGIVWNHDEQSGGFVQHVCDGNHGGIGTIYMLCVNGLLLGVIGAATAHAGMALQLWSFVAPHGVLELPAIFIAGGAGLEIARGDAVSGTATAQGFAGDRRVARRRDCCWARFPCWW